MWEPYQPPDDKPAKQPRASSPPDPGFSPSGSGSRRPTVAGGTHSRGPGTVIGVVAVLVSLGIGLAVASSAEEPDYAGFYACVAENEADGGGLLSPAVLCEIGHERPPDYVDDHEVDLFENNGFGNDNRHDSRYGY